MGTYTSRIVIFCLFLAGSVQAVSQPRATCHLQNPLCFYGTDILSYLQALYNVQQYEKMVPYLTGPAVDNMDRDELMEWIASRELGYIFQRVGIRELGKGKWSLRYRRKGHQMDETFTVVCVLEGSICRLYLDNDSVDTVFLKRAKP